jgi:hypothetical protein
MPSKDIEKLRAAQHRYKERHRESINARKRAIYAANAEQLRERQSEFRRANKEKVNAYNAAWSVGYRARLRAEFIAVYGGQCSCCGEAEPLFLHLDHIFDDGAEHRRQHKTGCKLLAALKREGWPKDRYRLLCANCNHGRTVNGGICPHERRGKVNDS